MVLWYLAPTVVLQKGSVVRLLCYVEAAQLANQRPRCTVSALFCMWPALWLVHKRRRFCIISPASQNTSGEAAHETTNYGCQSDISTFQVVLRATWNIIYNTLSQMHSNSPFIYTLRPRIHQQMCFMLAIFMRKTFNYLTIPLFFIISFKTRLRGSLKRISCLD